MQAAPSFDRAGEAGSAGGSLEQDSHAERACGNQYTSKVFKCPHPLNQQAHFSPQVLSMFSVALCTAATT